MAQIFTSFLANLSDPLSYEDVSGLVAGAQEGHKVTNKFYHKGILILEVVSLRDAQSTQKDDDDNNGDGLPEVRRRFLVLGRVAGDMVTLQIKNKIDPWISHGLDFDSEKGSKKQIGQPAIIWCKGLAMIHTGSSLVRKETDLHRMKQVTGLMQLVCDDTVPWSKLDFNALKAKVDGFEQYLDPDMDAQEMTQSRDSKVATDTTLPKSGSSMPPKSTSIGPRSSSEISAVQPPPANPNDSKRGVQNPEQIWEKIRTDMEILVEVYQEFAMASVKSVDPPVGLRGLRPLDMPNLIKPTSYPECVQQLMTALDADALHECCDDAFDALDYDIADSLCKASRSLMALYCSIADVQVGGSPPNESQKRACEKFMDEAKKYLQIWEKITEIDAIAKIVDAGWSNDSDARLEQLKQLATADGAAHITVDVVMQYMKGARMIRAEEQLRGFLKKVKRMTKALESSIHGLGELQN